MTVPENKALVTIMIATKDRPEELRLTLAEMRKQIYPVVEVLVIDDGSAHPVEAVVKAVWPTATVVRHDRSAGQCARRNEGFALAKGSCILQLDDDCSFVDPLDLERAVSRLQNNPHAGAVSFYVVNSMTLPDNIDTSALSEGCVASFLGAAVLFRKEALEQPLGYRSFFGNDWEEEELGLQLLKRGWKIIFVPQIIAHHRLSSLNRNSARTWMRGLRNRLWAMVIHMPFPRVFVEVGWKLTLGAWDSIRLLRFRLFLQALLQTIAGLPAAWRLREPLSPKALRRYDLLRAYSVLTPENFDNPPKVEWSMFVGFWHRWRNRARNRNAWDRREGDIGSCNTVKFEHEFVAGETHAGSLIGPHNVGPQNVGPQNDRAGQGHK